MLTPKEQRRLSQRLHDNPVFAQQFTDFRESGDLDRAAKHLCIAYQLFTLANELGHKPLYIAQGNMLNFKITQPHDLKYFRALKDI